MNTVSLLETAIQAAEAAAEAIRRARQEPLQVQSKGYRDEVTAADFAAERAIMDVIHARYPDHPILSEESISDAALAAWTPPPGVVWVIDPLDGTTNYAHSIPTYATSIGAVVDGVPQAGAIMDVATGVLFAGARGQGVTVDGAPARVSARASFGEAIVACDWAREPEVRSQIYAVVGHMLSACRSLRRHGSAALTLAYVAAGWYDVYLHMALKPWDMAAGVLMVQEAGGRVTTAHGEPFSLTGGSLLASNGALHEAALAHVRAALG